MKSCANPDVRHAVVCLSGCLEASTFPDTHPSNGGVSGYAPKRLAWMLASGLAAVVNVRNHALDRGRAGQVRLLGRPPSQEAGWMSGITYLVGAEEW